jgi:hypothetical protein
MAHTWLELLAVSIQPLSHGLVVHEPVSGLLVYSNFPQPVSDERLIRAFGHPIHIWSDTLTYRNLEPTLKNWRWMKLLHGAIHPTTKGRGLSCPISGN